MRNKPRLLTPGPTSLPERVRLALAQDMIHHRKGAFKGIMQETQTLLQQLFGTTQPVLSLSCSGTGAMTAAVHGLFAAQETVLVIEGGKFGQRWREIAALRGLNVLSLEVPWGEAIAVDAVQAALDANPAIRGVLVQVCETSTGVQHPVQALAELTRNRDVLLVADGISAVGITPCPMDAWGIDCLLTGSQKGLMVPPGLALMALSERAWQRAANVEPSCFYLNLLGERDNVLKAQNLFTSPIGHIIGLRESLSIIFEQGDTPDAALEALYRKQWALTCMTRRGLEALGLELFAPKHYAWGLTSVLLPAGVDGSAVLQVAEREYNVVFAGGQDHYKGRMVRFGHMGWVDWGDVLAGLAALASGLRQAGGFSASRDYLETALAAYHQALDVTPGDIIPDSRS